MKDSSYVLTIDIIIFTYMFLYMTYCYCDQIWLIFQELMHWQIKSYIETIYLISCVHTTKHNVLKSDLSAVLTWAGGTFLCNIE